MEKSKCVRNLDDFLKSFNFRNNNENADGKDGKPDNNRRDKTRIFNDYDNPNKKIIIQQFGFKQQDNFDNKPSNENESNHNQSRKVVKRAVVSYDDL